MAFSSERTPKTDAGQKTVLVVGAGAAGLLAAGEAALEGARVRVLEKMERPARKLRISGKGRCNLTNTAELPLFLERFPHGGRFLRQAFARFFAPDLIALLEELGVRTQVERGGRVFPAGEDAREVVDALVAWAQRCGAVIETQCTVRDLLVDRQRVVGVVIEAQAPGASGERRADAVVLATGGRSYPATGSTGDGYRLAAAVGHAILPVRPALVGLDTETDWPARLQGLTLRNVRAHLIINGRRRADAFGEMELTPTGVSGPIILRLSGRAVEAFQTGARVELTIDLKPALSEEKLDARLRRDLDALGRKPVRALLQGLLPRDLVDLFLEWTGLPAGKEACQVSGRERRGLLALLKELRLVVTGHRPWEEAIITAGGVDTREVDPRTMASRKVGGLYLCGELLDIDADTGGFNLQAAFSTGWLAGRSAARG